MDGAAILDAIRIFVALLGLAAIVAIVVRPLRLPYSVALVLVGLGAGLVETVAIAGPEPVVRPRSCSSSCSRVSSSRPATGST